MKNKYKETGSNEQDASRLNFITKTTLAGLGLALAPD
jgi:hypothetical protein